MRRQLAPNLRAETLETRNLLSTAAAFAPGVNLVGSVVQIGGTSGTNMTTVYNKAPGTIAVVYNGTESDFAAADVSKVAFQDNGTDYNYDMFANYTNVDDAFQGGHFINVAEDFGTGSSTFSDDATGAYENIFAGQNGADDFTSNGYGYIFYQDGGSIGTGSAATHYSG